MLPVLASAIVDPWPKPASAWGGPTDLPWWRVIAWGEPPYKTERVYVIAAEDDDHAAKEGIRRFVAEMRLEAGLMKPNFVI